MNRKTGARTDDATIRIEKTGRPRTLSGDGRFALGLASGIGLSILGYLSIEYMRTEGTRGDVLLAIPIVASLLLGGLSSYLALAALLEQRRSREASTDPVLIVHFGQREDARELITFKITNVGAGAAMNIALDVETPDIDLTSKRLVTNIFKRHHPFRVLPQCEKIEFGFAMGFTLLADPILPPFLATITYDDIEGGRYGGRFPLDIREMEKLGANQSLQARAVSALERIARTP